MSNESQAPLKVKTIFAQAEGNSSIHYVCSVVELYYAPGLTINPDFNYDFETNTISYTYSYDNEPEEGAAINSYILPIFLPTKDSNGELVIPSSVLVSNENNPDEKASGDVITSEPVVRPSGMDLKFPGYVVLKDTDIEEDVLRYFIAKNDVVQSDESMLSFYYLFVITKTNLNNEKLLQYEFDETNEQIDYSYKDRMDPLPDPDASGAVSFIDVPNPTSDFAYGRVLLEGNATLIVYTDPETFNG